jgi:hypothetical protein
VDKIKRNKKTRSERGENVSIGDKVIKKNRLEEKATKSKQKVN